MFGIAMFVAILGFSGCGDDVGKLAQACKDDDSTACKKLRDIRKEACENKKDAQSCYDLGDMYYKGVPGVKKDDNEAWAVYRDACDGKHGLGCRMLAIMHGSGQGVKRDIEKSAEIYKKAVEYFEKGCEKGNNSDCGEAGLEYSLGKNVEQDLHKSLQYFEKFCDNLDSKPSKDDLEKCYNIGYMYYHGLGTRQDRDKAKKYFGTFCDKGSQDSCDGFKRIQEEEKQEQQK